MSNVWLDGRSKAVAILASLLFVLNVADYLLTLWVLRLGGIELNPIMAPIISTPYAAMLKIVLVGATCYLIAKRLRFTKGIVVLAAITSIYVCVVSWNATNLFLYYS